MGFSNMVTYFLKPTRRVSCASLLRWTLIECTAIMGVTSQYLCHLLLIRKKLQAPPVLRKRELHKEVNTRRCHIIACPPEVSL